MFIPAISFASEHGLIPPCDSISKPGECIYGFNELMALINNVIHFLLFKLALPLSAIMFAYAGFLMITAGGAEGKTKAKGIFSNAVFGLVIAAAGWLIIRTILSVLGYEGAWIGF